MHSSEIRKRFLAFFAKRGHALVPSASLVPENDPSVLFTTAGMQPLVPYLLGTPHPQGTRLMSIQKCVRTGDIDDVGDSRHLTFFEMMGNWSLGDYFKREAIEWSYELLTSKEEGFGLDPARLYVTVFEGNDDAPMDTEAMHLWKSVGIPESRIFALPAEDNWWSPGENGPCGPDSEMFYDLRPEEGAIADKAAFIAAQESGRVVEIWNDVFMEYACKEGKVVGKLAKQNVDTGAGLERMVAVLQGKQHVFETDLFLPIIERIKEYSTSNDERAIRIVADHVRTAIFMIADGVLPSNTDRGYVLRRLIRRARYFYSSIGAIDKALGGLVPTILSIYRETNYNLDEKLQLIDHVINLEETKFLGTLEIGKKAAEKIIRTQGNFSGRDAFLLTSTYGYPFELLMEIAEENGVMIDAEGFKKEFQKHQEISRLGSEQKFKGGLAGHSEAIIKLHTATHLLNTALKHVLGPNVKQRGSNITEERLRFDFTHDGKMTDEEKKTVETLVNEWIEADLPIMRQEMSKIQAEQLGAEMEFGAKYPDTVSVYTIGDPSVPVSREFCGGPHVTNTGQLGVFTITKEEASSAGVRRIKATLS